jgi:ABC-type glycerol-3-phosphate transport system permease component
MSFGARFERVFSYVVLILAGLGSFFPIYWAISTSLKLESRNVTFPPQWVPDPVTLEHYAYVLTSTLPRNYLNSILLAIGTISLVLIVALHAGYAAARFQFRGKNAILFVLLSTIMVPGIVTLIPQYFLAVQLGLHDTYLVLVLIFAAWQTPTATWILRGFFETIPPELEEAAMVDGCTRIGAFYRVVVPLSQPGLVAAAILVFVWVWNEFVIALNLTSSGATRPLTVGLYFFVAESGIEWGRMAAAASLALIPVMILFAFLQRRFIQGLTSGAVK